MKKLRKIRKSMPGWVALQRASLACAATCMCGSAAAQDTPANAMKEENAAAAAEEATKTEADYRNWFDVSVGGNFISGDKAAFKQRHQLPEDVYGGVEEFHYEQDVGKKGLLEIDGRGIFDNEDYSLRISLEHPDYGFVRTGYREFRTWYDASGIYLPVNDAWLEVFDDDLHVNRGEYFFEAGLTLPNVPNVTFRYTHEFRDGQKGTTIYGDTARGLTGGQTRAVVPGFWDIDEERDIFELDATHTIKETEVGLGLRYELSDQNNYRGIRRRPFEPQDRYLTQRDEMDVDLFNVRAFQETWLNDTTLFTSGYAFTTFDTDIGGYRIYGSDYDIYDPTRLLVRDEGFFDLTGGSTLDQHILNLNLMFTPWENVTIVPSLRAEKLDQRGVAALAEFNPPAAGNPGPLEHLENSSERDWVDVSEGLEVRYTGITNWVLYTRGEWLQGEGTVLERQFVIEPDLAPELQDVSRDTDTMRFTQKYVAGVNWYPAARFNLSGQYYYKSRNNDYDHTFDRAATGGNRYPAYIVDQSFTTHDVNFRVTVRPVSQLTFVTRYDYQITTFDNQMDGLEQIEGGDTTSHILGETITWVPLSRLYLQGSINYVVDRTETPAIDILNGLGGHVQRSENDYIYGTAMLGYVLTEKTDVQGQYFIYKADNYTDNSNVSVPYNSGNEEHGVTAALIHRFTSAMQWTIKYGFFTATDQLSGGNDDYEAHMVFSSYRFRF